MHISLIGMSNIGKSHWSRQLAERQGYERIDCDTLLEHKLAGELVKLGYKGIHDVAKWMGQPYEAQYPETSRKYLACEREVMLDVIDRIRHPSTKPCVIDTTGSVIYTGDDVTSALKSLTQTVYFEASESHVAKLFERYMSNPKPVIWGDQYVAMAGESKEESLRRCYPKLLAYRTERYRALAHISVPYEQHKAPNATWAEIIKT